MIVDLNLKGRQVVIAGGGKEATRKVEALLFQDCEIIVHSEKFSKKIKALEKNGRVLLKQGRISEGSFLNDYHRLILVMAATDDKQLNRKIVEESKKLRCFAYAVDDPEVSDFNHPSVMNIHKSVQIAISTGGKSPLMAKQIRKKVEPVLNDLIKKEDVLKIQLQFLLREKIKAVLSTPDARKQFLESILLNTEINQLLAEEKLEDAETLALDELKKQG
ncbi:MAG: bifunctional precorrin-2 dehydrogenase/sirohydrochlorin ferrochelatase [Nitrospinae bacterium]|jgi:precorrin-2 dehydrogenase / sirohydrochlorin ferrochelatase|nr:bifunctional precorrin-2 dehydrogenase/sirohydrochlorin ferrochelatase [Nitrospinota bacterium]MDA1108317.1 bifunctional precorrin-2 dehydrogenase/sirohydrochlorin ferrochelatase [Nitrospinota bacterium]